MLCRPFISTMNMLYSASFTYLHRFRLRVYVHYLPVWLTQHVSASCLGWNPRARFCIGDTVVWGDRWKRGGTLHLNPTRVMPDGLQEESWLMVLSKHRLHLQGSGCGSHGFRANKTLLRLKMTSKTGSEPLVVVVSLMPHSHIMLEGRKVMKNQSQTATASHPLPVTPAVLLNNTK